MNVCDQDVGSKLCQMLGEGEAHSTRSACYNDRLSLQ